MSLKQVILNFGNQLVWEPEIQNKEKLNYLGKAVLCGMGGSHLLGGLILAIKPKIDLVVHKDYELPNLSDLNERLIIISSYSGNTEETISAFEEAQKKGLNIAIIASGGKLIELAKEKQLPYIELPEGAEQPRFSLGYSLRALSFLLKEKDIYLELEEIGENINPLVFQAEGERIAEFLKNKIPIIYASADNFALSYIWKIKFNETSKIPSFCNFYPELNHNEMEGFDSKSKLAQEFIEKMAILNLIDEEDEEKIKTRMKAMEELVENKSIEVYDISLVGNTRAEKIINGVVLADWTSLYLADYYGVEPERVEMVEEFKKII